MGERLVVQVADFEKVRRSFRNQQMSLRVNEGFNKGSDCFCRALRSFRLQLAGPPRCVPNGCLWFVRLHLGTVLGIFWTSLFERCVGCHTVRAGAFKCSPVVVGDTCEFETVIQCPNLLPPPLQRLAVSGRDPMSGREVGVRRGWYQRMSRPV